MTCQPARCDLNDVAKSIRRIVLMESKRANVGHIGSCLCVADILAVLYGEILRISRPDDPDRDRLILSKGHAALALFAALALKGWITVDDLTTFCGDDSLLGVHPEAVLPGVDFSTGSLGQGLSMAVGAALAARFQNSERRIFCLISDGECNEGAIWEAAMFAGHHKLNNLTVILDWNRQQAFGVTEEVSDDSSMAGRWRAFGWRTTEVSGHDLAGLTRSLSAPSIDAGAQPHIVLARTVFGKGVSYMEQGLSLTQTHVSTHPINWHYLPMSDFEYGIAMRETGNAE